MNFPIDKPLFSSLLKSWGASLVRVADTTRLEGLETDPPGLLQGYPRAVCIAVRLSNPILDGIDREPTPLYSSHYSRVNAVLDSLAVRAANHLQETGARSFPIPASIILNTQKWTSFLSHKAAAIAAGLGWQGKSLLVVSPEYGPRIRLVTVLTDADLAPDEPIKNRCGKCSQCQDHCPAKAIRGANTDSHYASRSEAIVLDRCVHQVRDVFGKLPNIEPLICGICVKACPWGRIKKITD